MRAFILPCTGLFKNRHVAQPWPLMVKACRGKVTAALQRSLNDAALSTDLPPRHCIARITESRGKGIFAVELSPDYREHESKTTLVSLPSKFRNALWIHRGTFVVVQMHDKTDSQIAGEISQILLKEQIKTLRKEGRWPFPETEATRPTPERDESASENEIDAESLKY
jgi:hypothetical protein